jgi:hypothetical protein
MSTSTTEKSTKIRGRTRIPTGSEPLPLLPKKPRASDDPDYYKKWMEKNHERMRVYHRIYQRERARKKRALEKLLKETNVVEVPPAPHRRSKSV